MDMASRGKLITWVNAAYYRAVFWNPSYSSSSLFINDMPEVVNSVIRMFTDDTKLFRTINRSADSTVLQTDLMALQEYSNKWQQKFNADKCKILHPNLYNKKT